MAVALSPGLSYDVSVYPGKGVPAGSQVGAFGDKFRTERERRGFTLDDVSNVTKINSRMLRAIEEEHFELLPGGVFNKGFVRAYAKHLGFNDEESVSEYLVALRQAQVQAQTAAWQPELPAQTRVESRPAGRVRATQPSPEQGRAEQVREEKERGEQLAAPQVRVAPKSSAPVIKVSPGNSVSADVKQALKQEAKQETAPARDVGESIRTEWRAGVPAPHGPARHGPAAQRPPAVQTGARRADSIPWKVPAVVLGVILVAAVLWNRHSRGVRAEGATHVPPVAAATNGESTPTAAAATLGSSGSHSGTSLAAVSSSSGGTNRELSGKPATAARDAADRSAIDRADTDVGTSDHDRVATARKSAAAVAAKAPPVFTLRIRASETSWISVAADGQTAVQETLIAPASTTVRASREITVRVDNAAAVSFLLNGKEIRPQGHQGESQTFTFDSQGIKESAQAAAPDSAH